MFPNSFTIAIAGSTEHTLMCVESLFQDERFTIAWILTPSPRKIGRKQELVKNPLHLWAEKNHIDIIFVDKKIDDEVKEKILTIQEQEIDLLLVVDFGYLIPNWLLELPKIAPVNIHPSLLPKYRGSSPGQFALLYGETESAVSVIKMNDLLDQGELIHQEKFDVLNTWNLSSYYDHSFKLISEKLANVLHDFSINNINPMPQPLASPTPIARRLNRDDGFVSWELLQGNFQAPASELLMEVNQKIQNWPVVISNAVRALSPWPGVWTMILTSKGEKRMKILEIEIENGEIELKKVQIEGDTEREYSPEMTG